MAPQPEAKLGLMPQAPHLPPWPQHQDREVHEPVPERTERSLQVPKSLLEIEAIQGAQWLIIVLISLNMFSSAERRD